MWDGEWSMENECWFTRHLNVIGRGTDLLLKENHWYREIIRAAHTPMRDADGPGSRDCASQYAQDVPSLARLYRIPMDPVSFACLESDSQDLPIEEEEEQREDDMDEN